MVRRVDVLPQLVYGGVPLELPLITMSNAEAIKLRGEPQIYDNPYPLDYDGLGLKPAWFSNTGMGNVSMLPHEIAQMSGLALTPAQQAAQDKRKAAAAVAAKKRADTRAAATAKHQAAQQKHADTQATAKTKQQDAANKRAQDAANRKAMQACRKNKGIWDAATNSCSAALVPPATSTQPPVVDPITGQLIDPVTGQPVVLPGAPPPAVAPQTCPPGFQFDPNYNSCLPVQGTNYPPPPPYPPPTSPIPPGYDSGGGGGGGFPMTPGAPPSAQTGLMPEQAGDYAPSVNDGDQASESDKDKTDDDSSQVASSNIFESIAKAFGFAGVTSGLSAPPPWIGMGGTNMPQFATAREEGQIRPGTTAGVILGSLVLIAGAAAIFLSAKGGKR